MLGLYNYSELFNIETLEKMQLLKGEVHTHITGCGSQYDIVKVTSFQIIRFHRT
jgi:hypothetical protein